MRNYIRVLSTGKEKDDEIQNESGVKNWQVLQSNWVKKDKGRIQVG